MDTNQTIQLKPMYSHINLYNAPALSATMPSLTLTSGLNIITTTNGSSISNISLDDRKSSNSINVASSSSSPQSSSSSSSTSSSPISNMQSISNNVCLSNIQLQQIHLQHQTYSQNQTQCDGNNIVQLTGNSLLHIPTSTTDGPITNDDKQLPKLESKQVNLLDSNNSNLSNESITSNQSDTNNSESLAHSNIDVSGTRYVDLAKASCSNSLSMRTNSSDTSFSSSKCNNVRGFKCQICEREFTQKGNLKTHLMTHSGERPYECRACGKNFTQKGNLDTHVKIHTETKDHKCQYCDRGFTQRGNLKTHIRSIHTKEKPYACGHCGKAFSQKGNMLTHFRTHDKEARFPCNVCGKTFSQKGNLKTHQQRHGRNMAK